ncbi:MAG: DUF692 family protein [Alphaproteobacteria bacterium]|nr:DUF692 family protein [Alphaproteobacteria bacterium]
MAPRPIDPDRTGIALDPRQFAACILQRPLVGWIEAAVDELAGNEPARRALAALRDAWPLGLRAGAFSLGSARGLDTRPLDDLAGLSARLDPARIVVRLAWPTCDGDATNPQLPLPYDDETLIRVGRDVDAIQARLRRPVLIENPPARRHRLNSALDEAQFLAALVRQTGCGIACDLANLLVGTRNHGGDPQRWLDALPGSSVGMVRIAGHGTIARADGAVLIADGAGPVPGAVWALHGIAARRFPGAPTMLAWTAGPVRLDRLAAEATRADRWRRAALDMSIAYAEAPAASPDEIAGTRFFEFGSGGIASRSPIAAAQRRGVPFPPGGHADRAASDRAARVGGTVAAAGPSAVPA